MIPPYTVRAWANALSKDADTIRQKMAKMGIEVIPKEKYSALQVFNAFTGNAEAEKARNLRLDAEEKEREAKVREGQLLETTVVESRLAQFVANLVTAFDAAPTEIEREWLEKVVKPAVLQKLEWK